MAATRRAAFWLMIPLMLTGCPPEQRDVPVGVSNDWDYLEPQPGPGLVVNPDSLIADVPAPIGFPVQPSESTSSVQGGVRHVHHVYQGRTNLRDVERFYQQQLPLNDWSDVNASWDGNKHLVITAVKGAERLHIDATDRNTLVTLTVDITPL